MSRVSRAWTKLRAPEPVPATTDALAVQAPPEQDIYRVLHLALRIGELLLSGGAGTADVTAAIRQVTAAAGLVRCEADVTYNVIVVSYLRGPTFAPVTASRVVRRYGFDGTRLARVDDVVKDLVAGRLDVARAQQRIDVVRRTPHPYPRWVATGSWGGLSAAIAVLLGGNLLVVATAFVATVVIDRLNRLLNAREVPFFYQYAVGGLVATSFAAALSAVGASAEPSLVVAGGLVALLPGGLLVGSVQDALGGFLVTASARALEVLVLTAGLLTGVALGLDVSQRLGVVLSVNEIDSALAQLPVRALAAAAAAGLFALANYSPRRVILTSALVGGAGYAFYDALQVAGLSRATATAAGAVVMGAGCQLLARRLGLAALLLVVPAIIPQLPGLTTFSALLALGTGDPSTGFVLVLRALTVGLALAAGVLLGQGLVSAPLVPEHSRLHRRRGNRLL